METSANKTIITVVGKDTVGIIAKVCTYLANNRVNVMDISQTIVQGFFNMMMIVDLSGTEKPFADISKELTQIGEETVSYTHLGRSFRRETTAAS